MTSDGSTVCLSGHGPKETLDRLVAAVTGRGMTILARIDHAAAAVSTGMELRPTEVGTDRSLGAMTDALAAVAKEATEA